MTEITRCSGHCCSVFFCPVKPDQLTEFAQTGTLPGVMGPRKIMDGEFMGKMLIPLAARIVDLPEDLQALYGGQVEHDSQATGPTRDTSENGYYYTCRHHNKETGDCMAYEQRPHMCREFPYGEPCKYRGCTRQCTQDEPANCKKAPPEAVA